MRKFNCVLLAMTIVLALISGCGGSSSSSNNNSPPQTLLSGVATDESGSVLSDVTVSVGTGSVKTVADGTYSLPVIPGTDLKVNAAKPGRVNTFHIISISSGQSLKVNFSLRAVGSSTPLTGMDSAPKAVTEPRGATVTLPAGSIVDSTGAVVTSATADVTTSLATDPNYTDNFPGQFVGTRTGLPDAAIESFGIITVDITSGGKKCNLGSGKTADIAIPVASGADPDTTTIDLWSLDETSGKWKHEGLATRDASASPVVYRATVSHFSTYNLDRPISTGMPFNVTVKNSAGASVAGATLLLKSTSSNGAVWEGRGTTGADGTYRFPLFPAGSISLIARSGGLVGNGYSYETINGEAKMTITLIQTVEKTFTLVYVPTGGVEIPAANATMSIFSEGVAGGGGQSSANTDAFGKVTFYLPEGAKFYGYNASVTVGGIHYNANGQALSLSLLPAKLTLLPGT
jgi:hypothetical protein